MWLIQCYARKRSIKFRKNRHRWDRYSESIRGKVNGISGRIGVFNLYRWWTGGKTLLAKNGQAESENFFGYGKNRRNQSVCQRK